MYEIWLTVICLITTVLGMVIAYSVGYKEGRTLGYQRGRVDQRRLMYKNDN